MREASMGEARLELRGWPPSLIKATTDQPFSYACGIAGLGEVVFQGAEDVGGGWVRLTPDPAVEENRYLPFAFARGVEVRVSDIRWVADAPFGS